MFAHLASGKAIDDREQVGASGLSITIIIQVRWILA